MIYLIALNHLDHLDVPGRDWSIPLLPDHLGRVQVAHLAHQHHLAALAEDQSETSVRTLKLHLFIF